MQSTEMPISNQSANSSYAMHTDGGSRGNPGPSAVGFSISKDGSTICEGGWPIGKGTNNEAEYQALIWGIKNALELGISELVCVADSELMVKQLNGEYKVKNPRLKELYQQACELISQLDSCEISHVLRASNKRPDELLNQALDCGSPVGTWTVPFDDSNPASLFSDDLAMERKVAERKVESCGAAGYGEANPAVEGHEATDHGAAKPEDPIPANQPTAHADQPISLAQANQPTEQPTKQATVLLGVTACIAAYKACEIVRALQRAGVRVKVVMTQNATEFIGPTTFRALTREPVGLGMFDAAADPIHHISLAKEADLMLIAPATANSLVKLSLGIADDLLSTTALACKAPILVAPAMNTAMWENPRTQEAVDRLRTQGVKIILPDTGYLSCGDEGAGRLADLDKIVDAALAALPKSGPLAGKKIFVNAGPTYEPIDPVRFLGNRSSGLSGALIASRAAALGADVTLVMGPGTVKDPAGVTTIHVQTALEMLAACEKAFEVCDAAVFTAAVSDFRPAKAASSKIKKDELDLSKDIAFSIDLLENPDVLASLASHKEHRFVVGFAAETSDVIEAAKNKLVRKNADLIIANDVSNPELGFGTENNRVWIVSADEVRDSGVLSKHDEAVIVVDEIVRALTN